MTSATGDEEYASDKHCSMLILTRRPEETIFIGDHIRVTFLGMQNGSARIAIHAPLDVPVHREEIYRRIQSECAGELGAHQPDRGLFLAEQTG